MRIDPPSSPQKFDAYVQSYDDVHASSIEMSGESTEYFHDYKIACLTRHGVGASHAVLDYGCGIGNLTKRFTQLAASVSAFDPSLKSIEVCRQRTSGVTFFQQTSEIPQASFDAVVLSGVLHHVPRSERDAVMTNVFACTKPGGRVFIFEHNPLNPLTRRVIRACPFDDDADLLWGREVVRLLRVVGFERIVKEYIVFFPRMLSGLRSLEPMLAWCPLGAQTLTIGIRPKNT